MANKSVNAAESAFQSQIAQLESEKAAMTNVANIAANQLLFIESRLTPLMGKKINIWNALFHLKEWLLLFREIIAMIQEFRAKFITKQTTDDTAQ